MHIFRDLNFSSSIPCVVALGCFDGVHIGHEAVIGAAVTTAKSLNVSSAVFAFSRPPKSVFVKGISLLSDIDEKLSLIESLDVDTCICPDPTPELLSVNAQSFIEDIIIRKLSAIHIVCGYNFRFGKGAAGDVELLKEICIRHGVGITVMEEYRLGGDPVSSSIIREHISNGRMEQASLLLGRDFSVTSTVVDGQHLARSLGFPTMNIIPSSDKLLPLHGVYAVRATVDSEAYYGIANVGIRPTVDVGICCVEAHLFNFNGDLYGKTAKIEFIRFLREERKFENLDALKEQALRDIETAKRFLGAI